ncbi:hypothetical protein [Rhizobium rhizogenes]|uniref:hypothetical protein n=1 Tax=Rhizobium rhizogenes TaxID=359 RepID=UPI001574887D|nr:hypothetical protein [Rhizobium rhizogenes]NTF43068.1 hypothetical protein [Rhizobium rhizogenes]
MGFLSSLTGTNIGKATTKAIGQNGSILQNLQTAGNGIIDTGEQKSAGALDQAVSNYDPYLSAGKSATGMYSDALGLNGADGNAAATAAFQAGPGYQFAVDQGTQAALRGASAAGMLNSGNTLTALTNFGQGAANQEYGSWLDRLNGLSGQGLSAANGASGALGNVANLYQSTANDRLGLESSVAQGQMGLNNDLASVKEQQAQNSNSFLGKLVGGGISLGTKALTGGLF